MSGLLKRLIGTYMWGFHRDHIGVHRIYKDNPKTSISHGKGKCKMKRMLGLYSIVVYRL